LDDEGYTWIVGQYRYTLESYSWEVPEGGGKLNDTPLVSAQRELLEETGITAQNWIEIGEIHTSNSVTDERGVIFVAKNLRFGIPEPEDTEQLELRRLHLDEAVDMVMRGEITDGLAHVAILKTKLLKDAGKL
jgi:8-oxo-dGTP pyrophosphatase MutT (NUDIX family)